MSSHNRAIETKRAPSLENNDSYSWASEPEASGRNSHPVRKNSMSQYDKPVKKASMEAKKRLAESVLRRRLQQARLNLEHQRHFSDDDDEPNGESRDAGSKSASDDRVDISSVNPPHKTVSSISNIRSVQASFVEKARQAVRAKAQDELIQQHASEIHLLRGQIDKVGAENSSLRQENRESKAEIVLLKSQMEELKGENDKLRAKLRPGSEIVRRRSSRSIPPFSVSPSIGSVPGTAVTEDETGKEGSVALTTLSEARKEFSLSFRYGDCASQDLSSPEPSHNSLPMPGMPSGIPRPTVMPQSSSGKFRKKERRPSTFSTPTLFAAPAAPIENSPGTFEPTNSYYTHLEDRNRSLTAMNDGMQSLLSELQQEVRELNQTNHRLLDALTRYKKMFAKMGGPPRRLSMAEKNLVESPLGISLEFANNHREKDNDNRSNSSTIPSIYSAHVSPGVGTAN